MLEEMEREVDLQLPPDAQFMYEGILEKDVFLIGDPFELL